MKLPNFTRPLYEVGEHNTQKIFFLFLNFDTVLTDSTQKISPAFDKLNEIKIEEIWNSANPLFKWHFGLLSSRNVATMATWRNDFSASIEFCFGFASLEQGGNWAELPFTKTSGIPVSRAVPDFFAKDKGPVCFNHAELFIDL